MIFQKIAKVSNQVLVFALLGFIGLVFYPILSAEFVRWDDTHYLLNNHLVRNFSWEGLKDIFTTKQVMGTYSPVVLISWLIDYIISGYNPSWFHSVNLGWHCLNSLLVFYLVGNWFNNRSIGFITALLFAIHPMNVEPVAWVTGRKDLVFSGFLLLSLFAYHHYSVSKRKSLHYFLSLLLFVLAVFAKAVAVVLPVIFLLLDYFVYRKKLYRKLLLEKIPFFLLSLVGGVWAIIAQSDGGAIDSATEIPWWSIPFLFSYRLCLYLLKFVYPIQLSNYYPFDHLLQDGLPWYVFGSIALLTLLVVLFWLYARKYQTVLFGVGFFCVGLLPVMQLIPLGSSLVADRYVYLPYIGLSVILASLSSKFLEGDRSVHAKNIFNGLVLIWVFLLAVRSHTQAKVWSNDGTLWSNFLKMYPNSDMGYGKLGIYYADRGDLEKAMECFNKEVELAPDFYSGYTNRGLLFEELGDYEKAFNDLDRAIELRDDFAMSRINRGLAYLNTGRPEKALLDFQKAVELESENPIAHFNLGLTYERLQQTEESFNHYDKAIGIDPNNPEIYYHRGRLNALTFRLEEALVDINQALEINPNNAKYYVLLSEIYISMENKFLAKENALQARARGAAISEEYMKMLE